MTPLQEALHKSYLDQQRQIEHWALDLIINPKQQAKIRKKNLKKGLWTMRNMKTLEINSMETRHLKAIINYFGSIEEIEAEIKERT